MPIRSLTRPAAPERGAALGSVIAGTFGAVFVGVNSGGLDLGARIAVLAGAGVLLALILVLVVRGRSRVDTPAPGAPTDARMPAPRPGARRSPFGRAYWIVVAVEAIALFGGTRALTALGLPQLGVAWVSVVVGTHFFALARVFRLARFHVLGAIVTVFGLAGFALHLLGGDGAIPLASGVLSGFALLGFGVWAMLPVRRDSESVAPLA